jgi:hypothetical protein
MDRQTQPAGVRMEEIEIGLGIPGRVEYPLAVIATLRDVVRHTREHRTVGSRHCWKVTASPLVPAAA